MTKAGGALWIQVDPPVDSIVRVDVATGSAMSAVVAGHRPKSGDEGLWVVGADWLARIDPATGEEMLRVPMGGTLALGDGAAWLANESGLHRINAETGAVGEPIAPGVASSCANQHDLAVAFASAWLACKIEGQVVRIDLATGEETSIATAAGTNRFTVTENAVWVTNYVAGSVSRIDPRTNGVTTIDGAGSGVGITNGGGYVWASTPTGIAKIDPPTASIVREVELGPGEYYELVWDDGVIWVSTRGSRILKVDPSKATP
jgi:streptogramin lyase